MLKENILLFLVSQLIGNVINLEMSQQSNDERDYENETAMKIDETMVNLKQSTFEPDAELIMISSRSVGGIKRRKRQADENPASDAPEDNPNPEGTESITNELQTLSPDDPAGEEPSVNLEVETSITKGPTTTFIGGIPLSLITRPNTTTTTTTITTTTKNIAMRGKVTYFTKKPIIFPSETTKITTKFTVGTLARQQATGLTFASKKAGMMGPTMKNMKIVSSTRKISTAKVQRKVEGTKISSKATKFMTTKSIKPKISTNAAVKATIKSMPTTKKVR